jgi:3-mercaptopyruvate sulfurtransferase SseA
VLAPRRPLRPDAFDTGHLPGAVLVDLNRWLAAYGGPADGRHPLPTPAGFAGGMASLGIGAVLAYDDAGGVIAAVLDARDDARLRGEDEPVEPRAGRVPGARNLPCRTNVDDAASWSQYSSDPDRPVATGG